MPLALEPNQKFPIVLDIDKDKPAESRPTFFAPSLSMRSQGVLSREMDEALAHQTTGEIFAATCSLLEKYVVDWKNMGSFEFGKAKFEEFLTHGEARELLSKVLANSHVSLEEKKS